MKQTLADLIILGGGLTGLCLAYFLKDTKLRICILEARPAIGGRIRTIYKDQVAPQEMGATWLGRQHAALRPLLEELGLETFEQVLGKKAIYEPISTSPPQLVTLPPNDAPSYRIKGGTSRLIQTLASNCAHANLLLNQEVVSLSERGDQVLVATKTAQFSAPLVVSTIPPNLLLNQIAITPSLPLALKQVMGRTHTWMGESIKIALAYANPFWRAANSSGTVFSNVGPISELYDHSNFTDEQFALKGFMSGSYHAASKQQRLSAVLEQLRKYYGDQVDNYLSYEEAVWSKEAFTYTAYASDVLPHENNGNPAYQTPQLDGKLIIAGSETATAYPGYMDGAIRSAKHVAKLVQQSSQ